MTSPAAAPVLSTPDTHIFEDHGPQVDLANRRKLSHEQLYVTYEIERTVNELRAGRYKHIALQFPDQMLVDAPRVSQALTRGLQQARQRRPTQIVSTPAQNPTEATNGSIPTALENSHIVDRLDDTTEKVYILADTSYGACCVDEVAAEHADADVVVHYGRACLSPTARLPVIYCFTKGQLALSSTVEAFKECYPDTQQKIILMADIPYVAYVPELYTLLQQAGYRNIFPTEVVYDTSSLLPNRTIPPDVKHDNQILREYHIFHISDPPPSLLLTLSSRVASIRIYPTDSSESGSESQKPILASSTMALRRRYALLTSLSTVSIFGILINTLSVKNYQSILAYVKRQIADAGKKSYTFVVGKVNAAKVANFSEVGGWVVIGCWESSLFESKDFWKPVITPFELGLALQSDSERVWTGEWTSDFQSVLNAPRRDQSTVPNCMQEGMENLEDSEEESEPPEYDLRTGRYVSHSRPMRTRQARGLQTATNIDSTQSLVQRTRGDLAVIGNEVSPAAEFFKGKRSWKGLGSDFEIKYDEPTRGDETPKGAAVEEGRSGIARGYTVGTQLERS